MKNKNDKSFFFDVQLNWVTDKRGILFAKNAEGTLHVATPAEFGGAGKLWSPEHYFLCAINSCFMTTYLAFAQKLGFVIANFNCEIIGQIEMVEGKYKFTNINLYPKVYIHHESEREKASQAMEKTHKYCLISNSVNADIFYHSEVLTEPRIETVNQ